MGRGSWMRGLAGLAVFLGCAWWLCLVPYRPDRLLAAIPLDAAVVMRHQAWLERWPGWLAHPLVQRLAESPEVKQAVEAAPSWAEPLSRLGGGDAVWAYAPRLGPYGEPAAIGAIWLGARSHWLRWILQWRPPEGVTEVALQAGRSYHVWAGQGDRGPVSFAFVEGMVLICRAAHPETIRSVLAAHDGEIPSWLTTIPEGERGWWNAREERDAGWGRWPLSRRDMTGEVLWRIRLEGAPDGVFTCRAQRAQGSGGAVLDPAESRATHDFLRDLPVSPHAVGFGAATEVTGALSTLRRAFAIDVATWIDDVGGASCAIALLGGEDSGRIKGVRCPALVVAVPCRELSQMAAATQRWIERLNRRGEGGWYLASTTSEATGGLVFTLASNRRASLYGELPEGERAAIAMKDGWALVSSNRDVLIRMLTAEVAAGGPPPGWSDVGSGAWVDLAEGGKTVRNGLAVAMLSDMIGADQFARWRRITEALEPLRAVRVRAGEDEQGSYLNLEWQP